MTKIHTFFIIYIRLLIRAIFVVFILFGILFGSALSQEKNSFQILEAIGEMYIFGNDIENLPFEDTYITPTAGGKSTIVALMKNQGYLFKDQMGAGHFFESERGDKIVITSRQFSRFFTLWDYSPYK